MTVGRDGFAWPNSLVDADGTQLSGSTNDVQGNPQRLLAAPSEVGAVPVQIVEVQYNERGLISELADTAGQKQKFFHDANANLIWTQDPRNCTSSFVYDENDRLTDVTWEVPRSGASSRKLGMHYDYDNADNVTKKVGPFEIIAPSTKPIVATTVTASNPTSVVATTLPASNPTVPPLAVTPEQAWGFDVSGRPSTITLPNKKAYKLDYRAADGKLDRITDPSGKIIQLQYDGGRYTGYVDSTGTEKTEWLVDGQSRLMLARRDGAITQRWSYDYPGLVEFPSSATWEMQGHKPITYKLVPEDKSGRLSQLIEPDGTVVKYTYTTTAPLDLLETVERQPNSPSALKWKFEYYPSGQIRKITYPEPSPTATYTYVKGHSDWIDECIVALPSGEVVIAWKYRYFPNGVVQVTQTGRGGRIDRAFYSDEQGLRFEAHGAWSNRYLQVIDLAGSGDLGGVYEETAHVDSSTTGSWTVARRNLSFQYTLGSFLKEIDEKKDTDVTSHPLLYQYPDPSENIKYGGSIQTAPADDSPGVHYTYNKAGQLISARTAPSGDSVSYAYLATGELASRTATMPATACGNSKTTYWVDLGLGLGPQQQLNESFTPCATFVVTPEGQKLARLSTAQAQYYVYSPDGSVALLFGHDKTLAVQPDTNAYGKILDSSRPPVDDFGFGGAYRDPDTGLIHLHAGRWYDSQYGRFLQPTIEPFGSLPYQFGGLYPTSDVDLGELFYRGAIAPMKDPFGGMTALPSTTAPRTFNFDETMASVPLLGIPVNASNRYRMLKEIGIADSDAQITAGILGLGEPMGFDRAAEAYANIDLENGGAEFTTGGKALAYGQAALSLVPVLAKAGGSGARYIAQTRAFRGARFFEGMRIFQGARIFRGANVFGGMRIFEGANVLKGMRFAGARARELGTVGRAAELRGRLIELLGERGEQGVTGAVAQGPNGNFITFNRSYAGTRLRTMIRNSGGSPMVLVEQGLVKNDETLLLRLPDLSPVKTGFSMRRGIRSVQAIQQGFPWNDAERILLNSGVPVDEFTATKAFCPGCQEIIDKPQEFTRLSCATAVRCR